MFLFSASSFGEARGGGVERGAVRWWFVAKNCRCVQLPRQPFPDKPLRVGTRAVVVERVREVGGCVTGMLLLTVCWGNETEYAFLVTLLSSFNTLLNVTLFSQHFSPNERIARYSDHLCIAAPPSRRPEKVVSPIATIILSRIYDGERGLVRHIMEYIGPNAQPQEDEGCQTKLKSNCGKNITLPLPFMQLP